MSDLNKKELDKLLKIKGEVRGVAFHTDGSHILKIEGEEALKKIEKRTKELGYSIDYRNPPRTSWFPVGLRAISLIIIKDTLNWNDEDIKKMGWNAPSFSFIIKLLMKFFVSLDKVAKESPHLWKEHYKNIGRLFIINADDKEKIVIVRVKDFKVHPIFCPYFAGYFSRIASFGLKEEKKNLDCVETKCVFDNDSYHEFKITW